MNTSSQIMSLLLESPTRYFYPEDGQNQSARRLHGIYTLTLSLISTSSFSHPSTSLPAFSPVLSLSFLDLLSNSNSLVDLH